MRANKSEKLLWNDPERPWLDDKPQGLPLPRLRNPRLYHAVFHTVAYIEASTMGVTLDPKAIGFLIGKPGMKIWGNYTAKQGDQYLRQVFAGSRVRADRDLEMTRLMLWISGAYPLPKKSDVDKKGLDECLRVLVEKGWLRRMGRGRYGQDPSRSLREAMHHLQSAENVEGCTITNFRKDRNPAEQALVESTARLMQFCGRVLAVLQAHAVNIPDFKFDSGWDLKELQDVMHQPYFLVTTQPSPDMTVRAMWYRHPEKYQQFLSETTRALQSAAKALEVVPVQTLRTISERPTWAIMGAKSEGDHERIQSLLQRMAEEDRAAKKQASPNSASTP